VPFGKKGASGPGNAMRLFGYERELMIVHGKKCNPRSMSAGFQSLLIGCSIRSV